jgi:DNA-binding GntR family transcriptional regulator
MLRQNGLVGIFNARNRPPAHNAADIHDAVLTAIVDQRLPPATKLGEEALVEVFNLGRRLVSAALDQLSWEGLVTRLPNRGAFVATPEAEDAREIFAARQAIESGVVEALARSRAPLDFSAIEAAMAREHACRAQGRLREAIRLSGGFHVSLAFLSGNRILADQVRLLVARTSLVVALFENPGGLACWHDDHKELLAHIRARRVRAAATLMQKHLQDLLDGLDLTRQAPPSFDLRSAFHPS